MNERCQAAEIEATLQNLGSLPEGVYTIGAPLRISANSSVNVTGSTFYPTEKYRLSMAEEAESRAREAEVRLDLQEQIDAIRASLVLGHSSSARRGSR